MATTATNNVSARQMRADSRSSSRAGSPLTSRAGSPLTSKAGSRLTSRATTPPLPSFDNVEFTSGSNLPILQAAPGSSEPMGPPSPATTDQLLRQATNMLKRERNTSTGLKEKVTVLGGEVTELTRERDELRMKLTQLDDEVKARLVQAKLDGVLDTLETKKIKMAKGAAELQAVQHAKAKAHRAAFNKEATMWLSLAADNDTTPMSSVKQVLHMLVNPHFAFLFTLALKKDSTVKEYGSQETNLILSEKLGAELKDCQMFAEFVCVNIFCNLEELLLPELVPAFLASIFQSTHGVQLDTWPRSRKGGIGGFMTRVKNILFPNVPEGVNIKWEANNTKAALQEAARAVLNGYVKYVGPADAKPVE